MILISYGGATPKTDHPQLLKYCAFLPKKRIFRQSPFLHALQPQSAS
jgi:hypothetical protein